MAARRTLKWTFNLFLFLILLTGGCVTRGRYDTDTRSLSESLDAERGNAAELKKRVSALEQQLAMAQATGTRTETDLKAQMTEIDRRKAELAELQATLDRKTREADQMKATLHLTEEEAAKRERELQESAQTQKDLVGKLEKEINEGNIKISRLKDRLSVEIVDKILFASGSDQVTGEGKEVLTKVADILKGVKENSIRIEGHTDNVPIGTRIKAKFPSNWELSTSRATQVVRLLIDDGVDPGMLLAVGRSEYQPVASNDTPEGRQRNRRIEIVLFPKDIQKIAEKVLTEKP